MKSITVNSLKAAMRMGEKLLSEGVEWFKAVLDSETGKYTVIWKAQETPA